MRSRKQGFLQWRDGKQGGGIVARRDVQGRALAAPAHRRLVQADPLVVAEERPEPGRRLRQRFEGVDADAREGGREEQAELPLVGADVDGGVDGQAA